MVVYDIGLSAPQRDEMTRWRGVHVRQISWDRVSARALRLYAWKIMVWSAAVSEFGCIVFIDACSEVRGSMQDIHWALERDGVFMTVGAHATPENVARDARVLTHKAQVAKIVALYRSITYGSGVRSEGARGGDVAVGRGEEEAFDLRGVHCLAGLVGFNGSHAAARSLLTLLERCAEDADCIAPLGANLSNHRFEQSALSVSAQLLQLQCHEDQRVWGYYLAGGEPSVPIPDDELAQSGQVIFARRRALNKPYAKHVLYRSPDHPY